MDAQSVNFFIQVPDRAATVAWFRDMLGLAHSRADDFGDEFRLTESAALRLTAVADFTAGAHPNVGWQVQDLGKTVTGLRSKDIRFETFEGLGQDANGIWTAPDGSTRLAWFKDLAGNLPMLSERH